MRKLADVILICKNFIMIFNIARALKCTIALTSIIFGQFAIASYTGTCGTITGAGSALLSGTVQLSPLAPIGSLIGSEFTAGTLTSNPGGELKPSSTNKPPYYTVYTVAKPIVSGITYNGAQVYETGYTGIGLAMWGQSYTSGPKVLISNSTSAGTFTVEWHYALIKTASTTATGYMTINPFSSRGLQCIDSAGATVISPSIQANAVGIIATIATAACGVTTTSINVSMGDAKRTSFTGLGSTSSAQNFTIPLSCNKATKVSISISPGASGAYNTASGILNIDPANSGVKATGIGIQLLYNNVPLPLNTVTNVGSVTAASTFNVPLSARYYQTANTVTAGSANGTATFVMTYN